jgi:hypothetical protein
MHSRQLHDAHTERKPSRPAQLRQRNELFRVNTRSRPTIMPIPTPERSHTNTMQNWQSICPNSAGYQA